MKALIIEDEAIAARRVERLLKEINQNIHVIGICEGIQEAEALLKIQVPDIIISDINLCDGLVFELSERVDTTAFWIFTSAFNTYVERAYSNQAFDFLLKPIRIYELKESVIRAKKLRDDKVLQQNIFSESKFSLLVRFGSKYNLIKADQISYFYYKKGLTIVVNKKNKTVPVSITLANLINHLDSKLFVLLQSDILVKLESIRDMLQLERDQVRIVLHPSPDSDLVNKKQELKYFNNLLKDNTLDQQQIA